MMTSTAFLDTYMTHAPLPLAFERTLECRILSQQKWTAPILDLGCGDGIFAGILFHEPVDVGLDPDPKELDRARTTGAYKELVRAPGAAIPFPDAYFNTVFANSVLEHIPDLPPVLDEVHRVLDPGGRFYVTLPTELFQRFTVVNSVLEGLRLRAVAASWQRFFNRFWSHHNVHDRQGWRELFRSSGFRVVDERTYDPRRVCVLNDFLVPFSVMSAINRRVFGRWLLTPRGLRRYLVALLRPWAERILAGAERAEPGGLVFFSLEKAS